MSVSDLSIHCSVWLILFLFILHCTVFYTVKRAWRKTGELKARRRQEKQKGETWAKEGPRDPLEMVTDNLCVWTFLWEVWIYLPFLILVELFTAGLSFWGEATRDSESLTTYFFWSWASKEPTKEARRHTYHFWNTQPVPKIGMTHIAQVETA